jgi:hypothetical protein
MARKKSLPKNNVYLNPLHSEHLNRRDIREEIKIRKEEGGRRKEERGK